MLGEFLKILCWKCMVKVCGFWTFFRSLVKIIWIYALKPILSRCRCQIFGTKSQTYTVASASARTGYRFSCGDSDYFWDSVDWGLILTFFIIFLGLLRGDGKWPDVYRICPPPPKHVGVVSENVLQKIWHCHFKCIMCPKTYVPYYLYDNLHGVILKIACVRCKVKNYCWRWGMSYPVLFRWRPLPPPPMRQWAETV